MVLDRTASEVEAIELVCQRPQMLIGDDRRDTNPVVRTEVSYAPIEHSWRVFHHLADGGVVSRSEQYAIVDMTKLTTPPDGIMHWTGSLNQIITHCLKPLPVATASSSSRR